MLCPSMSVSLSIVPVYNEASLSPSTTIYLYRNVHRYRPGTTYTACGVNKAAEHPVPSDTQPCPTFLICQSCHIWCKTHILITKKWLFLVSIRLIFDWLFNWSKVAVCNTSNKSMWLNISMSWNWLELIIDHFILKRITFDWWETHKPQ